MPTFSELADLIEEATGRSDTSPDVTPLICEEQHLNVIRKFNPDYKAVYKAPWKEAQAVWYQLDHLLYGRKLSRRLVDRWNNIGNNLESGPDFQFRGEMPVIEPFFYRNDVEFLRSLDSVVADGTLAPTSAQHPKARHSPDFRSVHWYGTDYTFTPNQAACVELLWHAWEQGTPELGDGHILGTTKAGDRQRLRDVFKNCPAWGTMIVRGAHRDTVKLLPPDSHEIPA